MVKINANAPLTLFLFYFIIYMVKKMKLIITIIAILIILKILQEILEKKYQNNQDYNFKGKVKASPLTEYEKFFYNKLSNITKKYEVIIMPKLRLADIFETNNISDFNKIKSKHIDFTLCNKNLEFIMFIELDDSTHNKKKNIENDIKKNKIFENCNKKIFRIKNSEIDEKLKEIENEISTLN